MATNATPKSIKTTKIIYWIATILFVLPETVLTAVCFNNPKALEGMHHLGFPNYFRIELSVGKIIGGILLLLPIVPARLKEWVYVAFGISCISAFIANWAVDGPVMALSVLPVFVILLTSYICYHKLLNNSRPL